MEEFNFDAPARANLLKLILPKLEAYYADTKSRKTSADWDTNEVKAYAQQTQVLDHAAALVHVPQPVPIPRQTGRLGKQRRNMDHQVAIHWAGFQDDHAVTGLAQPVGQDAACGTGADDHVVGFRGVRFHRSTAHSDGELFLPDG